MHVWCVGQVVGLIRGLNRARVWNRLVRQRVNDGVNGVVE